MRIRVTLFSALALVIGLMIGIAPSAQAETLTFPCGPNGETYSVAMPAGIAFNGKSCLGALNISSKVSIIEDEAFSDTRLTEVNFPGTLKTIKSNAFKGTWITEITIPDSVVSIGYGAFSYSALKKVTLPNSITTVGAFAFTFTQLKTVKIPNSVLTIGPGAFANSQLGSVILGDSVEDIGFRAFEDTKLESIELPESLVTIGDAAFINTKITSIIFPNTLKSIGYAAFANTLLIEVKIPESVENLGDSGNTSWWNIGVFSNTPLRKITLPNSLVKIGPGTFARTQLTNIEIPKSVKSIGGGAFWESYSLEKVSLPDDFKYYGELIFSKNYSLTVIEYCGSIADLPITPVCPPDRQAIISKDAADRAAAELKVKQEADARAAAELKAQQEAAAQDRTDEVAAVDKLKLDDFRDQVFGFIDDLKSKLLVIKGLSASDRKKSDSLLKEIASTKEIFNKITNADQGSDLFDTKIPPLEVRVDAIYLKYKKATITCVKGKLTKKVTAVKPVCPKGYKKKA